MTYWSPLGLSVIASKVGVPLYEDEITSETKILEFARVCVEMQVGCEFPTSFTVQTEHNETFEVRVKYSWKPRHYSLCKVFRHNTLSCPTNETKLTQTTLAKPTKVLKHWLLKNHNLTIQVSHNQPTKPSQNPRNNTSSSSITCDPESTNLPPPSKPSNLTIWTTKNLHTTSLIHSQIPSYSNRFFILEDEVLVEGLGTENKRLEDLEGSNLGRSIEERAKCEGTMGMFMVHGELGPLVEVLEESMDGNDREGYKSDHKNALNLNAKSEEEEEVPPIPGGRKRIMGDKIDKKRSKRVKKSAQRRGFTYFC